MEEEVGVGEGELEGGGGDEGAGGEGEEGGAGLTGEVAKAVPGGGGDGIEFGGGVELEVEDEEGEVAVAEEEVGAAEGFVGVVATDPEETGAGGGSVGGGVEGVAAVDQRKRWGDWGVVIGYWGRVCVPLGWEGGI